ncbi:hypothetical protein [Sphingomonas sp. SRS2]|uniref:hypothetical protein n=1 Tax=Sphingomonas sp. SRS2 TaxID=133190 RepID=UPI00128D264F|nr:hypothetical protein [Sphingomonas sp. SRS2]
MRGRVLTLAGAIMLAAAPAQAGIESIAQLEPEAGEWEAEWFGAFDGDGEQEFELLTGLTDQLALGGEVEFEGPRHGLEFESVAALALWRFTDPDTQPLGFGLMGSAAINRHGDLTRLEARAIGEVKTPRWWLQGNAILRHSRDDGDRGTGLAYSASVQTMFAGLWLGVEASGQAARLSGDAAAAPRGRHYAGPSLTFEHEYGEEFEVEIGLAWLARLRGDGPDSAPRVFVQFTF